ncbi:MAG TPA: alpha/beta hydrolase [Candidatus Limnocylindrales bacterium]
MIRRALVTVAALGAATVSIGPVSDWLARRLMAAPRRLPEEAGMAVLLDRLGGEVVRLRCRDGIRLTGRWLAAEAGDDGWVPDPREAILLLHGYSGSVTPDLVELGPSLRRTAGVLGLDFRGHGGSDDGPTTFGLQETEDVAGALAWLGERGVRRVALVGSSMGGITAIAATVVLGDGRLPAADIDPDAPAATVDAPRPRIVAIVADSVAPEIALVVGRQLGVRGGVRLVDHAFARFPHLVGGDPRSTQPIAAVGLLEDMPLLLVHGGADRLIPQKAAARLAAAAPHGTRHLVVPGAGHGEAHAKDPAAWEAAAAEILRGAFAEARD